MAIPRIRGGSLSPAQTQTSLFANDVAEPVVAQEVGADVVPAIPKAAALTEQVVPSMMIPEEGLNEEGELTSVPAEPTQDLRDITLARESFAESLPLSQMQPEQGASVMTENVNQRLMDLTAAKQAGDIVEKGAVINPKTFQPFVDTDTKADKGDVGAIFDRANDLTNALSDPQMIAMSDPNDPTIQVSAGDLTRVVLGTNVDLGMAAMALDIATFSEVADINAMRLMNQEQQQKSSDAFEIDSNDKFIEKKEIQNV